VTTIFDRTATALATLSVPYANQVYIPQTGTPLPDQFIVFFLVSSQPVLQADDAEKLRGNRVQVSIYDRAGLQSPPDIDAAMVAAGFKRSAKNQLPYNQETRHYGLAFEYTYLEDE
jgi:hypothetical protein